MATAEPSVALIQAVAVTAELCGRTFSPEAAAVFVGDLAGFPEQQVFGALTRCRKEVRGMLTVSDVVSRLDDGRPTADEAWAAIPFDDSRSVVWTAEMCSAWGVALPLLQQRDPIAARMAFRDAYNKAIIAAREHRHPVEWTPSLGYDVQGREVALRDAVDRGRISLEYAREHVPALAAPAVSAPLIGHLARRALEHKA